MNRTQSFFVCSLTVSVLLAVPAGAQQAATVNGAVLDPLGARVSGATVTLAGEGQPAAKTKSSSDGSYAFSKVSPGRYQVVANASGFDPSTSDPVYVAAGARVVVDLTLQLGPVRQAVVVTAAASELIQSQTGAPVTVIDFQTIEALNKPDLLESIRLVPSAQVVQNGARGGVTSVFLRGGNSNFSKVLIDGVPANDIGGGFDFSQLQTTGVESIEVLRQSNSVIYGSDALTGVINITTRRGRARVPELMYSIDGGNLSTFRNELSVGGAVRRFDYFSSYSYFTTDNSVPNNQYENRTYAGRFGLALGRGTDLSGTLRRIDTDSGSPNGHTLFGISDDSQSDNSITYSSIAAQSQWTDRWQSTVRFGVVDQTYRSINPTPTGTPFDPFGFGAQYLGNRVTLTGANGYSVTGQGILDYVFGPYPSTFDSRTTRKALFGQTTYRVASDFHISGGVRYDHEQGYDDPDDDPTATRDNGGFFVEGRGSLGGRTYVSAGIGYEHSDVFKSATTPRLSVATYLRNPAPGSIGDTKVVFNIGTGIKATSVFYEQNSLYELLQTVPRGATVDPIGPERNRSVDIGVEQGFASDQLRLRISYFRNTFEDLIEYVGQGVLPQLGVPADVAQAAPFGAAVNAASFRSQGMDSSAEAVVGRRLRLMASYTFLDAVVTESFASGALRPAINPAFPGVPIGQYGPLIGARPFRRPTHSGTLMASFTQGPGQVTLSSYFAGKRDDSTFLDDGFFGYSMLLPNRDLEPAYQKVDLSAAYRVHPRLRLYLSIENLLGKDYEAAFGFPSLPRAARAGVTVNFGGDPTP